MNFLVTSDLHFTDKKSDSYRFDIFDYFIDERDNFTQFDDLFILGDITDRKDKHSAFLVNHIVEGFSRLSDYYNVYILMGNHDFIDYKTPFFGFLSEVGDLEFIKEPTDLIMEFGEVFRFIPSGYSIPEDPGKSKILFLHYTFNGSVFSNGQEFRGNESTSSSIVSKYPLVISGDIHVPQRIGKNIYYCGSPYRVRFGDNFTPSILEVRNNTGNYDLRRKTTGFVSKVSARIDHPDSVFDLGLITGDQLKVELSMSSKDISLVGAKKTLVDNILLLGLSHYEITVYDTAYKGHESEKRLTVNENSVGYEEFCEVIKVSPGTQEYDAGKEIIDNAGNKSEDQQF